MNLESHECHFGVWSGEGIGPEIVGQAQRVIDAAADASALSIHWSEVSLGRSAIDSAGVIVPEAAVRTLKDTDGWLMGPYDSGLYPETFRLGRNPSATLRKAFDLYANIRPSRSSKEQDPGSIDLVIVRENTEGFYSDRNMASGSGEFMPTEDLALSIGVFTRNAATRVAQVACDLAASRDGRVTVAHKANVLPLGMGLFREACFAVGESDSRIEMDEIHLDALAAELVSDGAQFDVLVMENLAGDVLSNLTAALSGGLGAAASLNVGGTHAMAQASHGSAPSIAGKGLANPIGIVSSGAMLLDWVGRTRNIPEAALAAERIVHAVESTRAEGLVTSDMGGRLGTTEVGDEIVARIR